MNNVLTASEALDLGKPQTELHFPGQRTIHIPTALLMESIGRISQNETPSGSASEVVSSSEAPLVASVIEEQLEVAKRTVETGKVRLEKHVQEQQETLDVPLTSHTFQIERIPFNEPVEARPPVRQEGDVTIYSLVEERLVCSKQLFLKEELHVIRVTEGYRDTRTVTLKSENVTVTRT